MDSTSERLSRDRLRAAWTAIFAAYAAAVVPVLGWATVHAF
jgi:hypothetical protein